MMCSKKIKNFRMGVAEIENSVQSGVEIFLAAYLV